MDREDTFVSIEDLRYRLQQAKSKKASLEAELQRIQSIPTRDQVHDLRSESNYPASENLVELSKRASLAEECSILYRTTAWTVFEIDLDVGQRERSQRRRDGESATSNIGLGVRLDTFWNGRFYEPYYLVFATEQQILQETVRVSNTSSDYVNDEEQQKPSLRTSPSDQIRLMRHTLPQFVPLQQLLHKYLSAGSHSMNPQFGGLDLLRGLMERQGLWAFLRSLHCHLQSFVSRRQQADALRSVRMPGRNKSNLEAFGNDSFTQMSIYWATPVMTEEDLDAYEHRNSILYNDDGLDHDVSVQTGDVRTVLQINIQFDDFDSAHLGLETQTNVTAGRLASFYDSVKKEHRPGLQCRHGSVLTEVVYHKVPPPHRGGNQATVMEAADLLSVQRERREDLERLFSASATRNLYLVLEDILEQVWKEEMDRFNVHQDN